jgi:hypothetical protein
MIWRRAIGIEEMQAVEMVGERAVIGFHAGDPDRRHACGHTEAGKTCENAAAGDGHVAGSRGDKREKEHEALYGVGSPGMELRPA